MSDAQRRALVDWLCSEDNDGGWHRPAAKTAAWAFEHWLEFTGLTVVSDDDWAAQWRKGWDDYEHEQREEQRAADGQERGDASDT